MLLYPNFPCSSRVSDLSVFSITSNSSLMHESIVFRSFGRKVITRTPAKLVMSFGGFGDFGASGFSSDALDAFLAKLSMSFARASIL